MQNLYSEDDTRVKFIDAKLYDSSWNEENIKRNYYFTDGRKLLGGKRAKENLQIICLDMKETTLL